MEDLYLTKEEAIAEHRKMWNWIADRLEEHDLGYDCTNLDNPILVYDVIQNGNRKPLDKILDLYISGITVADDNTLLILSERNN